MPNSLRPGLDADETQLVSAYNRQADEVHTINASVEMSPTTGSAYSGVIHEYHRVSGFVLAARPALIRVIGQAPVVGTNIFDMVSDGQMFRIFIPSKNQFLVGSNQLERAAHNPIENLWPQHLLDALFWVPIGPDEPVVLEQVDLPPSRYYVLSLLRQSERKFEIVRKIWFDRSNLRVARLQVYGPGGRLDSDITYGDWKEVAPADTQEPTAQSAKAINTTRSPLVFPRTIHINRPRQDYQLVLTIAKLSINGEMPADRFTLAQPAGTELVNVGAGQQAPQP